MVCDTHFLWRYNTHAYSSHMRIPRHTKSTTKAQLSEPMIKEGVRVRAKRSRNDSKTAAPPKSTPAWAIVDKAGILQHTAQPAHSSTCWRAFFFDDSVVLNLFQGAQVVSASSRQLDWFWRLLGAFLLWESLPPSLPESLLGSPAYSVRVSLGFYCYYTFAERGIVNLVSFRDSWRIFYFFFLLNFL